MRSHAGLTRQWYGVTNGRSALAGDHRTARRDDHDGGCRRGQRSRGAGRRGERATEDRQGRRAHGVRRSGVDGGWHAGSDMERIHTADAPHRRARQGYPLRRRRHGHVRRHRQARVGADRLLACGSPGQRRQLDAVPRLRRCEPGRDRYLDRQCRSGAVGSDRRPPPNSRRPGRVCGGVPGGFGPGGCSFGFRRCRRCRAAPSRRCSRWPGAA